MKKLGFVIMVAFLGIGSVFAQRYNNSRPNFPELITVEGTLELQNGFIAVLAGETVYFVPLLQRYIGFIEGLKEGNKISIEGYAFNGNFLRPTKVKINEKSYDFPAIGFAQRKTPRFGQKDRSFCPAFGQGHYDRPEFRRMGQGHWLRNRAMPGRGPDAAQRNRNWGKNK